MSNEILSQNVLPTAPDPAQEVDLTTQLVRSVKDVRELLNAGESSEGQWLVDRLVPQNSITSIIGEPTAGKSFIGLQLAYAVASGQPLFGEFTTRQGNVLIISKEDNAWLTGRRAAKLGYSADLPIYYTTHQDWVFSSSMIDPALDEIIRTKHIQLIIIDSFRRVFAGDENSSGEVSIIHRSFKRITDQNLAVIFIHHQGKASYQNSVFQGRGSSDITAMVDYQYDLHKKDNEIRIVQSKARYTEQLDPFIVSFPSFNEGDCEFTFVRWDRTPPTTNEPTVSKQAEDSVIAILQNSAEPIYQGQLLQQINDTGIHTSHGTLSKVLEVLVAQGRITKEFRSRRNYFSLVVTETVDDQSSNQLPSSGNDLIDEGAVCN